MARLAFAAVPKRATNISLSQDVYADAKTFGINVSQVCEQALRSQIDIEKARRWAEEHAAFIDAYNKQVEDDGVPLAQWRSF
jgi:antitoxin CcdA